MGIKICHLTTVHTRYDIRIFHKECKSLAKAGFDVNLIVADGQGDEEKDGIKIWDIGKPSGRKERMLKFGKKALQKALEIDAQVYHFHDPELIPIGLKLKKYGKKVIYDVHEDVPALFYSRDYIPKFGRSLLYSASKWYEAKAIRRFDYIVTPLHYLVERFKSLTDNVTLVGNYPLLDEYLENFDWEKKEDYMVYVGAITRIRGIVELVKAMEFTNYTLHLVGKFEDEGLEREVKKLPGWRNVIYHGYLEREKARDIREKAKVGIVNYLPLPNHVKAQPNKFFEYMASGLVVLASNFPNWSQFINNKIGYTFDPANPADIADVINTVFEKQEQMREFAYNGWKLVKAEYNWEQQANRLFTVYEKLLNK